MFAVSNGITRMAASEGKRLNDIWCWWVTAWVIGPGGHKVELWQPPAGQWTAATLPAEVDRTGGAKPGRWAAMLRWRFAATPAGNDFWLMKPACYRPYPWG